MTSCSTATLTNMFISVDILDKFWPDMPLEFAAMRYYGMDLHKTVPENCNTVTRLDRAEDEISTTLGRSANEKNYAKELNRLALQQKDTEIGTFFFTLETLFSTKKAARRLADRITETYCKAVEQGCSNHRLIRSNETRNLTNCKWQDTFDLTTIILLTDY